jgi:NAD(P)-dependent dehydrogenase (short-subunit alcohol dehydrogenase family)
LTPTWFITGCSTGLGRALAGTVLERGHQAVVTARDPDRVRDITDPHPDRAVAVALDVTDAGQISAAVAAAEERFGAIDVLVNNAGYGFRGAVEETDADEMRRLFDTNVFGAVAMTQAVLPGMRRRRSGAIVNISSIGARIALPGSGYYAASKAALEALTKSLQQETGPLGITAMVVEPGAFRTDFAGRSLQLSARVLDDYAATAGLRRQDPGNGKQPGDPHKAAEVIIDAVESPEPPALLVLGADAINVFRQVADAERADLDRWEAAAGATAF